MNATIFARIREYVSPRLDTTSGTGTLNEQEHATAYALFELLTADADFPREKLRSYLDQRTENIPGFLKAYRDGLAMLDSDFATLDLAQRDAALRKLLRRFPYKLNQPAWRRKFRVTGTNIDQIFAKEPTKRFRNFVVRDLLWFYYQGREGWGIVDYDEFPGHVRHDDEECEILRLITDDDDDPNRVLIELSDATVEQLDPAGLVADEEFMLTAAIKNGRQRAGFAQKAYYQMVEFVDMENEDRFVLKLGDQEYEIPCVSGGIDA